MALNSIFRHELIEYAMPNTDHRPEGRTKPVPDGSTYLEKRRAYMREWMRKKRARLKQQRELQNESKG
jgi:hypothetical protein